MLLATMHCGTVLYVDRIVFIRSHSEDEEEDMDIKLVNMNLVTPFKAPVHAVKPAIKTSVSLHSPRYASSRRDSVKFSDIIERPSSDLSHR